MLWINAYDRSHKPTILDLRKYFSSSTIVLLESLNNQLFNKFRIKATPPRYTKRSGWVFPYRLQGVTLFLLTIQNEASFAVDEIIVEEESGLQFALAEIDQRCQSGFMQKVENAVASRKESARNTCPHAKKTTLSKFETSLQGSIPEKLNKFTWIPALPPTKLRELYRTSANGMLDQDMLEEIGLLFFLRCQQGVEEFTLLRSGKLKCHHCGFILSEKEGLMVCKCGYQYTFKEYINSFNAHRMPGGNALHIFSEYVEKWPKARTDFQKMNLIDWMIHQCHISMSSGLRLRSILKNLIDAPQKTAEKLILELAYDDLTGKSNIH